MVSAVHAQSANDIDWLLSQPVIPWSVMSEWTFASAGETYNEHDAFFYAVKLKAIPQRVAIMETPADLAGLAQLIMRTYNLNGGLFYRLFHNRRYAFRELLYLGIFDRDDDPNDRFSGAKFIQVLSAIQNLTAE